MTWITFAYSLPKTESSARVTLWRRLQRLGAVAPAGNLYVLPATDDCIESFQWLTQEIQQKGGQAIMARCDVFEGMDEATIIALFCAARAKEYEAITADLTPLEQTFPDMTDEQIAHLPVQIGKLRRQLSDIGRIDYFNCEEGSRAAERLNNFEQRLRLDDEAIVVERLNTADFQGKTWLTRPQPHVDRLASLWLIKRFIDDGATIRYGHEPADNEITFDMSNARFGHTGHLCTFETLVKTFGVAAAGLTQLAEIVHAIDLNDGRYTHAESVGIAAVLHGWRTLDLSDAELEQRGLALFDGLLSGLTQEK